MTVFILVLAQNSTCGASNPAEYWPDRRQDRTRRPRCSASPWEDHVIPNIIHTAGGALEADTPANAVRASIGQAITAAPPAGLVFHFHGGLVSERTGREIAARLDAVYRDAGVIPFFHVWESGLHETLLNNAPEIAKEAFFRIVRSHVENFTRRKLGQGGADRSAGALPPRAVALDRDLTERLLDATSTRDVVDEPEPVAPPDLTELSETEQSALEYELSLDAELTQAVSEISTGLVAPSELDSLSRSRDAGGARASRATLMDPAALQRFVDPAAAGARGGVNPLKIVKAVVMITARVIHRYVRKRNHKLHATVVEEILREFYIVRIGSLVWSAMKKDTADAFNPDPQRFGGSAILAALAASAGAPPRVTLVGHSAGTVAIAHFLQHAHATLPAAWTFDVVLLAPAVTCSAWSTLVLDSPSVSRIRNIRVFAMDDTGERDDVLLPKLPFLYPSSLLYLVSGAFEDSVDEPLVGMQRFYARERFPDAKFPHVARVRDYDGRPQPHHVWSVTAAGAAAGRRSEARSHGAFDEDPATLASLQAILRTGF